MDAAELPLVYHIGLVLAALWAAGALGIRHSVLFLLAFIYLYMVNARCAMRLRKRIQHEEMKSAYQRRVFTFFCDPIQDFHFLNDARINLVD
jgi:hypothetical protein